MADETKFRYYVVFQATDGIGWYEALLDAPLDTMERIDNLRDEIDRELKVENALPLNWKRLQ